MIGQGAVDFVQLLFAFDVYFDGRAGIVALAALAGGDVVGFGIGRVLADGFQDIFSNSGCALPMTLMGNWQGNSMSEVWSVMADS